jgi:hypothetical protein
MMEQTATIVLMAILARIVMSIVTSIQHATTMERAMAMECVNANLDGLFLPVMFAQLIIMDPSANHIVWHLRHAPHMEPATRHLARVCAMATLLHLTAVTVLQITTKPIATHSVRQHPLAMHMVHVRHKAPAIARLVGLHLIALFVIPTTIALIVLPTVLHRQHATIMEHARHQMDSVIALSNSLEPIVYSAHPTTMALSVQHIVPIPDDAATTAIAIVQASASVT